MGLFSQENEFVAQPNLNQFQAATPTLDETNYQGAQSAGANVFGAGINEAAGVGGMQGSFAQQLMAQQAGQGGPSLAELLLKDATARGNANVAGMLASQKGLNPALAARMAAGVQGQNNQQAAAQAAQVKMQERLNAQGQLGNVLASQRAGALQQGQLGAGLFSNAGQLQNSQNAVRSQNALTAQQLNQQAALANQNALMQAQAINSGIAQQNVNSQNAATGAILQTGGMLAGAALGPGGALAGQAAGKAAGGLWHGGPVGYAQGGEVEERPSFARMVAHHIVHMDQEKHPHLTSRDIPRPPSEGEFAGMHAAPAIGMHDEGGLQEPQKMADGGTVDPSLLQQYKDYVAAGGDAGKFIANGNVSNDQILDMIRHSGRPADMLQPESNLVRNSLGSRNITMADAPAAQGAQSFVKSPQFDPGNFGGWATPSASGPMVSPAPATAMAPRPVRPGPMPIPQMPGAFYRPPAPVSWSPVAQAAHGAVVPGQAEVDGDSPKNDKVPAMLSPGEVVLPRSISHDPEKARRFVAHLSGKAPEQYSDIKRRK